MAHGGARPNSGRKLGSATRKTRELAARAAEAGISPLEVMLRAMREHVDLADSLKAQAEEAATAVLVGDGDADAPAKLRREALTAITQAAAMAKDAAPYIHPRLANINSVVDADVRASVQIVSEFPDG